MYLETNRLIIRNIMLKDAYDYYEIGSDYKTAISAGWLHHESIDMTFQIIQSTLHVDGEYAIILKENNKMIGTISLYQANGRSGVEALNLGFALSRFYRKQGYMHEACLSIMRYAFEIKKTSILCCAHDINNKDSCSVIRKLPFKEEGLLRRFRRLSNGDVIDCRVYSITKEEYDVYQKSNT